MPQSRILRTALLALLAVTAALPAEAPPKRRQGPPSVDDPLRVDVQGVQAATPRPVRSIVAAADGSAAFIPSPDGLRLLKISPVDGQVLASAAVAQPISSVRGSQSGALVAAVSSTGGSVSLFRADTLAPAGTLVTGLSPADAAFSADGSRVFVSSGYAQRVQGFDLVTGAVQESGPFNGAPGGLALVGDGSRLAVGGADTATLTLLDTQTLQPVGTATVPAASDVVCATGSVIVATSALSGTVTVLDAATLQVLKTVDLPGAGAAEAASPDQLFVARGAANVEAVDADPTSAWFGEVRASLVARPGLSTLAVASQTGAGLLLSGSRLQVVSFSRESVTRVSRIDHLAPNRGIPGGAFMASGQFPSTNVTALFMKGDVLKAFNTPSGVTATSFQAEVPLELSLGSIQVRASNCSVAAVQNGLYWASSGAGFEVIAPHQALDLLIADLTAKAAGANLDAALAQALQGTLASLQIAKSSFDDGQCRAALGALWDAFRALESAQPGSPELLQIALIVQSTLQAKLSAVTDTLTAKDVDVLETRRLFELAHQSLLAGECRAAISGFLGALDPLERAVEKARRLRPTQIESILGKAIEGVVRLDARIANERILHHDGPEATPYTNAINALTGMTSRKGTLMGHLQTMQPRNAVDRSRDVVSALVPAGAAARDLRARTCRTMGCLVAGMADAVEHNIGPYDQAVTRARRCLAQSDVATAADDGPTAASCLLEAMGQAVPSTSKSSSRLAKAFSGNSASSADPAQMQLFSATDTTTQPCKCKTVVQKPITGACLKPDGIHPSPIPFTVTVTIETPGSYGYLFVSIIENGTTVKTYEVVNLSASATVPYTWDGKNDGGAVVTIPVGKFSQEFVVHAQFICYSAQEPTSCKDDGLITLSTPYSLRVEPSQAELCCSTLTKTNTKQFQAFDCDNNDVTADVCWQLGNPVIGSVAQGLFTAAVDVKGKGTITATDPKTGARGTADVEVMKEAGGMVPSKATLCPFGIQDFDIYLGCEADGSARKQNDQDYTWDTTNHAIGVVDADGFFTALAKGDVTVTATNGPGAPFTATVHVGDADDMEISQHPNFMCIGQPQLENFEVILYCHGNPVDGVPVSFTSGPEVTILSPSVTTSGGGKALTKVKAGLNKTGAIGGTFLMATADQVSAQAAMTVADIDSLEILHAPAAMCSKDIRAEFTVRVLCHNGPRAGIPVEFSSNDNITFEPSSGVTLGDGTCSTRITPTKASAAVGSTLITATASYFTKTHAMTVYSLSLEADPPKAVCADGHDNLTIRATIQPLDTVFWTVMGEALTVTTSATTITIKGNSFYGSTATIEAAAGSNCRETINVDIVRIREITFDQFAICADNQETVQAHAMVNPPGRQIEWSISQRIGASDTAIDPNTGIVYAGIAGGVIRVRAEDAELHDCFAEADLNVYAINITSAPAQIEVGGLATLTAFLFPNDRDIVWSIQGDPIVASVFGIGDGTKASLSGSFPGTVKVRAEVLGLPDCYDEVTVQVVPAPPKHPTRISISPPIDYLPLITDNEKNQAIADGTIGTFVKLITVRLDDHEDANAHPVAVTDEPGGGSVYFSQAIEGPYKPQFRKALKRGESYTVYIIGNTSSQVIDDAIIVASVFDSEGPHLAQEPLTVVAPPQVRDPAETVLKEWIGLYRPIPSINIPDLAENNLTADTYAIPAANCVVRDWVTFVSKVELSIDGAAYQDIPLTDGTEDPFLSNFSNPVVLTGLNALRSQPIGTRKRYLFRATNFAGSEAFEELILEVLYDANGKHVLRALNLGSAVSGPLPGIYLFKIVTGEEAKNLSLVLSKPQYSSDHPNGETKLNRTDAAKPMVALDKSTIIPRAGAPQQKFQRHVRLGFDGAESNQLKVSYETVKGEATIKAVNAKLEVFLADHDVQQTDRVFVRLNPLAGHGKAQARLAMRPIFINVFPDAPDGDLKLEYEVGDDTKVSLHQSSGADVTLPLTLKAKNLAGATPQKSYLLNGVLENSDVILKLGLTIDGKLIHEDRARIKVRQLPRLAGQPLPKFPHFYPVEAFNVDNTGHLADDVYAAVDPYLIKDMIGKNAKIYIVKHKTPAEWAADSSLSDVTGSVEAHTVDRRSIKDNTVKIWSPAATADKYDVVFDFGDAKTNSPNGKLDPGDLIGSLSKDRADFSVLEDPGTWTKGSGNDIKQTAFAEYILWNKAAVSVDAPNPTAPTFVGLKPAEVTLRGRIQYPSSAVVVATTMERVVRPNGAAGVLGTPVAAPGAAPEFFEALYSKATAAAVGTWRLYGAKGVLIKSVAAAPAAPPVWTLDILGKFTGATIAEDPARPWEVGDRVYFTITRSPLPLSFPVVFVVHGNHGPHRASDAIFVDDTGLLGTTQDRRMVVLDIPGGATGFDYRAVYDKGTGLWTLDRGILSRSAGTWAPAGVLGTFPFDQEFNPAAPVGLSAIINKFNAQTGATFYLMTSPATETPDRSYRGYEYLMDQLCKNGFACISISEDNFLLHLKGNGISARAEVLRETIKRLKAGTGVPNLLQGQLDFSDISVVGHSRGGEVVNAALKAASTWNQPIKRGIAIAPTRFNAVADPTDKKDYLVIYGSADGDVDNGWPFTLYDQAEGLKHFVYIDRANHNYFNDSWPRDDARDASVAGLPQRWDTLGAISAQQDVAKAYSTAFLLDSYYKKKEYRSFFLRDLNSLKPPSVGLAAAGISIQSLPAKATLLSIDEFGGTPPDPAKNTQGSEVFTKNMTTNLDKVITYPGYAPGVYPDRHFYQDTAAGILEFDQPVGTSPIFREASLTPGPNGVDLSNRSYVSFRIAQTDENTVTYNPRTNLNFTLGLTSFGSNSTCFFDIDSLFTVPPSYQLALTTTAGTVRSTRLDARHKSHFKTIRVPLSIFMTEGRDVDLKSVGTLQALFDSARGGTNKGSVAVDDFAYEE